MPTKPVDLYDLLKQSINPNMPIPVHVRENRPSVGSCLTGTAMLYFERNGVQHTQIPASDKVVKYSKHLGGNLFFVKTQHNQYFVMVIDPKFNKKTDRFVFGKDFPALTISWIRPRESKYNNNWMQDAYLFYTIENGFVQSTHLPLYNVQNVRQISTTCFLVYGHADGPEQTDPTNIFSPRKPVGVTYIVLLNPKPVA